MTRHNQMRHKSHKTVLIKWFIKKKISTFEMLSFSRNYKGNILTIKLS